MALAEVLSETGTSSTDPIRGEARNLQVAETATTPRVAMLRVVNQVAPYEDSFDPGGGTPASERGGIRTWRNSLAHGGTTRDRWSREAEREDARGADLEASAAGDAVAMFILYKLVESEALEMDVLVENLEVPRGWLAFGRAWRAGLLECYGDMVVPTDAGVELARRLRLNRPSVAAASGDE